MKLYRSIRQYAGHPIPHQIMISLLKKYHQPNDKIHQLMKQGALIGIKKGLYIAGPEITSQRPHPFLLASHITGPSYVSMESALSYYGMIPEKVYEITSVTVKSSRRFPTAAGLFSYTRLPLPYYSYGIRSVEAAGGQYFLIASPEKALFDKIVTTAGVDFRSRTSVLAYMENDLRIDAEMLKQLNSAEMESWLEAALKKKSLERLIEIIQL
ncbi:MAG: hypothetical protein P0Y53_13995 [Candidatus Pseudobacter hemicellulosilyticus]|uniref:Transcriptional regulator, AbiEi antitoxin, Type IV TA system n=1 Tax=Candidatus Pseudobacter hemicellulosilyticus TaxID=3121375 RepID=A0AAJ5WPH0_9BACT|nr:MAG: hypothetical protein P0Y53_13995 [Pseudobacter sp.]